MSENVMVNGVAYNGVEALALVRADGTVVTFYPDAVRYSEQTLTEAQKAQARANIGAQAEFTEADKEEIVQQVIAALGTPVFGTVDADKRITLTTDHLADGTYELGYEDKAGNWVKICTLNTGDAPAGISILDTYELHLNKRWSASGKSWKACPGMLSIKVPFADIKDKVVRFTGFVKDKATSDDNNARWYVNQSDDTNLWGSFVSASTGNGTDELWDSKFVDEGGGTYSIKINATNIFRYYDASVVDVHMNMVINDTGTAITSVDLANFSMIIADE